MKFVPHTEIPEIVTISPIVLEDSRGYFFESFRLENFHSHCGSYGFVQENQSFSQKGILRGLHYQLKRPQGKLVSVLKGKIFDVAIDIRQDSKTFGAWTYEILSSKNHNQLWIPPGFAHGFYVLSESAILSYKCTDYFFPEGDRSINWEDPFINVDWPIENGTHPILSEKDRSAPFLKNAELD